MLLYLYDLRIYSKNIVPEFSEKVEDKISITLERRVKMAGFKNFFKYGHPSTLYAAFLYFDF